jgi:SAM-dependent methyltransferase
VSPDDREVRDAYDDLARSYGTHEDDPYCADFESPATRGLVPEVAGRRVLNADCGRGRYAAWLSERGTEVVAVDASAGMVAEARERLPDEVAVCRGDLRALPVATDGFDAVVSGLALHYLTDWRPVAREFAGVLRPGGFLVFSTHDPVDDDVAFDAENYFAVERRRMTLSTGDDEVVVPFYRRPSSAVVSPLLAAGFRLGEVVEPTPEEGFAERKPDSHEKRTRCPTFLRVRATHHG